MVVKLLSGTIFLCLLVACGGSSTSSGVTAPKSADEYSTNITSHQSGKNIYSGNVISNGEMREFMAAVTNQSALVFMAEGDGNAANVTRTQLEKSIASGTFKRISWSSGSTNYTSIVYLDSSTSEEVYIRGTMLSDIANIVTDGSKLTSIPSGSFTYTGGVLNYYAGTNGYTTEGNFTMLVDFDAGTANLTANPGSFNISANNITVNTTTGTFSSNNVSMQSPGDKVGIWTGELDGTFTGSAASGVIGVYSLPDTSDPGEWTLWTGAFAGTR